jgi:hypothetical protein
MLKKILARLLRPLLGFVIRWVKFVAYQILSIIISVALFWLFGGRDDAFTGIIVAVIIWIVDACCVLTQRLPVFYWGGTLWHSISEFFASVRYDLNATREEEPDEDGREIDEIDPVGARIVREIERNRAERAATEKLKKEREEELRKAQRADYAPADVFALPDDGEGSYRAAITERFDEFFSAGRRVLFGDRVEDLAKCPHMLIAGTTGSGKSCFLHSVICGLLIAHTPRTLRLSLCDPKITELSRYNCPHLLHPVATSDDDIYERLTWICDLIRKRYDKMSVHGWQSMPKGWPRVVVVLEELPALLARNKRVFLPLVEHIAELGRAAGIHLIITAQRPDKTTLGRILQNVPMRVSFRLFSPTDSRTVFGQIKGSGAELLKGAGNGVYYPSHRASDFIRFHAPLITAEDVATIQESIRPLE